jgi:hypothetical protein
MITTDHYGFDAAIQDFVRIVVIPGTGLGDRYAGWNYESTNS